MAKRVTSVKLELLEISDYASNTWDNKLNILGIFDEILVTSLPAIHSRLFVVSILNGEPESKHKIDISIKNPQGKEITGVSHLETTLGKNGKTNLTAEFADLVIKEIGRYKISLEEDGNSIGEKYVLVQNRKNIYE